MQKDDYIIQVSVLCSLYGYTFKRSNFVYNTIDKYNKYIVINDDLYNLPVVVKIVSECGDQVRLYTYYTWKDFYEDTIRIICK